MNTPIIPMQRGAEQPAATGSASPPPVTAFNRRELGVILSLYGRMVAAGEWRDYAIDHLRESAIFSVFHRTTDAPLFRIEKHPKLQAKQGAFQVVGADGRVLKRGHDLAQVMRIFDRKLVKLVEG